MKIDWVRKLTSRKFWLAVIGFVTALLVAFKVDNGSIEQVSTLIMSFATLISYILAEGMSDCKGGNNGNNQEVSKDSDI